MRKAGFVAVWAAGLLLWTSWALTQPTGPATAIENPRYRVEV